MEILLQNKLGHQDELLRVMFEHATVGIVMANEEGAIIRCNPYATRMFGYEFDELVGQQIETLIPNKFHSKHLEHRKSYLKNPVSRHMGVGRELFAKRKDGKEFPVEVSLSYAQDGGQKIIIAMVNDITLRIEKEKELIIKSEAISSATIPICFADLEGNITYANPAFVKLWGFTNEQDLIGKSNRELGTSPEKVKEIMEKMQEKGSWSGYDKAKKADGTPFDVFLTTSLVRNGGGIPICTIATFMDITELRQTQHALEEKSQTLRTSMQIAKLGSWQFDLSTNTIFFDEKAKAIFDLPTNKESLNYKAFVSLFLPDDQQVIIDKFQHTIETKSSCKNESLIVFEDNEARWISSEAQALLNEDGEVVKVMGVSLDITKQKKQELQLLEYSNQLEEKVAARTMELMDSQAKSMEAQKIAKVGYWDWDLTTDDVKWSEQMYENFGLKQDLEVSKKDFFKYLHPDDKEYVLARVAAYEDKLQPSNYRIITPSGEIRHMYALGEPSMIDENGTIIKMRGIIQDITKTKQFEIALKESQAKLEKALKKERELSELKSRFVSMASHEFRTPLSSILSSAELIGMYIESSRYEKCGKNIERIKGSVRNLTGILNDFLSLEKLESGKVKVSTSDIQLSDYLEELTEEITPILRPQQQLLLQLNNIKVIQTDPYLLKNILLNLISNAVKYSPNGENVTLEIAEASNNLIFKVIDQGIGIPETDKAKMFSRFFRASNVETIKGTGLGLTIVKRYLDLMKGSIDFESEHGKGSTFFIRLPQ